MEAKAETQEGYFFNLTPDAVLEAVEISGLRSTGRCTALNSFENRVYEVELDIDFFSEEKAEKRTQSRIIAKFYRPKRWTFEQIQEEHEFILDLCQDEIPVIAPLSFPDGGTLRCMPGCGIWYALFPKVGGRAPDELTDDQLRRVGRLLGRIHQVGASKSSPHRMRLDPSTYGYFNLKFLLEKKVIPLDFQYRYQSVVEKICEVIEPWFQEVPFQRIHGDCHLGNLLWNDQGPFFLDFDDMVVGPPVQDLWLLVPGRDLQSEHQREVLIQGYQEFKELDRRSLRLIEPLRALRYVNYSAWIARRWADPAFPLAFPHYGSYQYWSTELEDLESQLKWILSSY